MKRRGISLSEMMVACSLVAILLPLSGKLLWTLANENRKLSFESEERRTLLRLIGQVKADALDANAAEQNGLPTFVLSNGNRSEYETLPDGVERRVLSDRSLVHRENYRFRPKVGFQMGIGSEEGGAPSLLLSWTGDDRRTTTLKLLLPKLPPLKEPPE